MLEWIDFSKASIFCGLLTIYLLLFQKNALRSFSDYLLSSFILAQCWTIFLFSLVYSGSILDYPHLYKLAAPITFLIPPLGYLYVRSVLFNERNFKKIDLLHLLPFLFITLNYLPFFAESTESKLAILTAINADKNAVISSQIGLFPESFFYLFRPIQLFLYLFFQWQFIHQFNTTFNVKQVEHQIRQVIRWLKIFTLANTLILLSFVIIYTLYLSKKILFDDHLLSEIPNALLSISFFVITTYLLVFPQILNGLPFVKYVEQTCELLQNELVKVPFIQKNYKKEIAQLEAYFASSKAYLQPNLSITEVAVANKIPSRELSFLFNSFYKQRFSDYINDLRLTHFLSQVDASSLDNFTIESIATVSGFAHKSSFYRAFKKKYNSTPTAYFQHLISSQNAEKSS